MINLLESGQIAQGKDMSKFIEARSQFEDATMYVEIDFNLRPARVLLFDGFEDEYIIFIGISDLGRSRLKCKKELFPKSIIDEISRREIPYIINVGKLNMLVKENTLQQLARRLSLSRIKLKCVSEEAAREIAINLNKSQKRVALRKCGNIFLFINVYKQDIMHKSMIPVVEDAIKETGYTLHSWELEQTKTVVTLKGPQLHPNGIHAVLEITFSDMLSFSEEIRFGVKKDKNPYVIYTDRMKVEEIQEKVKQAEDLLKKACKSDRMISFYSCFNEKYKKLVGMQRVNVITHSDVEDRQTVPECISMLLYTVKQVGYIPFSTENSLLEVGEELKKQLTDTTQ